MIALIVLAIYVAGAGAVAYLLGWIRSKRRRDARWPSVPSVNDDAAEYWFILLAWPIFAALAACWLAVRPLAWLTRLGERRP